MTDQSLARTPLGAAVNVLLPILVLAMLIALCAQLLVPFIGLMMWTVVLAICFFPVQRRLKARGMSNKWSATIIGLVLAAFILIPISIAAISAASSVPHMISSLQSGDQQVRPPPDSLKAIPVVGAKIHSAWTQAATDMPAFAKKFGPEIAEYSKWALAQAGGMISAVLMLLLAVVFASIALAYAESTREFVTALLARMASNRERGEHYVSIIGATVRSVANGVIGVAFVQALLCGIGFFVVGIPGAGILSLLAMALGVVQVPVVLVTLPAIIYAFSVHSTTAAILFTVWFIVAGLSDAVLKPMMIGHGLEVPMPVILLGVIGGVIAYGLVGLFVGAVVLAVGWVLMREWLEGAPQSAGEEEALATSAPLQAAE